MVNEPRQWVTVAEAAALTGRSKRTIYEWIQNDKLATWHDSEGIVHVLSKAVVRIAPTIRRGRPRGIPTRR